MTTLNELGWKPVFQQQTLEHFDEIESGRVVIARVVAVQRTGLQVRPEVSGFGELPLAGRWFQRVPDERPTVGDWVLVSSTDGAVLERLERTTEIKRRSPSGEIQLIAANIDTAFVVSSANQDFSVSRLERYLAALAESDIQGVAVITKSDLSDEPDRYGDEVRAALPDLPVEVVNALDPDSVAGLRGWCGPGQTIALLGSSGVGKSTLVNTLAGEAVQSTGSAREADAKGRHTTTHRSLHLLPTGGVILDSPGMREFQLTDAEEGVTSVFGDIESLAERCRFSDCAHQSEPGCAVLAAIEAGELEERRLTSYFKLKREERFNTETIAQRHARYRQFNRMVKNSMANKEGKKRG